MAARLVSAHSQAAHSQAARSISHVVAATTAAIRRHWSHEETLRRQSQAALMQGRLAELLLGPSAANLAPVRVPATARTR